MARSIPAPSDAASDASVSMHVMHDQQISRQIAESMKTGAARMLDESMLVDAEVLISMVEDAQRGSQAAARRVVQATSQLVYRIAETNMRKWSTHLPEHAAFDDVFAGGLEGLQVAINRFDADKGYAFTTYATWWIRNGVQRVIYDLAGGGCIRAKALVRGVAPDDPLGGNSMLSLDYEDDSRPMHETVAAASDEPFDIELVASIYGLLSCVDPKLPEIVDLLHRDYAYREIARIVGIPARRVRELHEAGADALERSGVATRG